LIPFAGETHDKTKLSRLYQLDLNLFRWTEIKMAEGEIAPCARSYHSAEIVENNLVVFGGEFIEDLDDTLIFNFNTNSWKLINTVCGTLQPKKSKFHSSFVYKNRLYVLGGSINSAQNVEQVIYLDFNTYLFSNKDDDLVWSKTEF
jgi:hypothetical protein